MLHVVDPVLDVLELLEYGTLPPAPTFRVERKHGDGLYHFAAAYTHDDEAGYMAWINRVGTDGGSVDDCLVSVRLGRTVGEITIVERPEGFGRVVFGRGETQRSALGLPLEELAGLDPRSAMGQVRALKSADAHAYIDHFRRIEDAFSSVYPAEMASFGEWYA